MPLRSSRAPRRLRAGVARVGALAALALTACACAGGDDAADPGAVPSLLTAPVQASSTSSTSSTSTTTTTVALGTGDPVTTSPSTVATSSSTTAPIGDTGPPSGPGSLPDTTPTTASSAPGSSSSSSTTPPAEATSTTADIEPPPPSLAPTVPVPTAAQPPDTIGGQAVDFLLAPRAIAGLQFGASRTTVLNRLIDLLGDPLSVTTLPDCPGGPATALQWFNAGVIITNRGLAYYIVRMNVADYGTKPVPQWHTATGLQIGADRVQLETVYPLQIAYATPTGAITPFTVTAGADSGLRGQLKGDVVDTIASGAPVC